MPKFSITKYGKPLDKSLYTWDEQTKTFSSNEDSLVLDFISYNNCTFNTSSYCTFKTGSSCTFNTSSYCTFNTGSDCTFNTGAYCTFDTSSGCTFKTNSNCTFDTGPNCVFVTGWGCTFDTCNDCTFNTDCNCTFNTDYYCTFNTGYDCTFKTGPDCTFNTGAYCTFDTSSGCKFKTSFSCTFKTGFSCTFDTSHYCVLVRGDIFEFYDISNVKNLTTAPCTIKGYVNDGYYYRDGKKQYEAIIADGILSKIINHKGNVYKVKNYGRGEITYLVQDGDVYSHGKTLKEAKEGLLYKLSDRDTSQYKDYTLDTKVSKKEAIQMYRAITGACEQGTRMFVESLDRVPKVLTVMKIIELTKGQYGNNTFKEFFERKSR